MPIYEYHCIGCNTIYQFLVKRSSSTGTPSCPRCGTPDGMKKLMSAFSVGRSSLSPDGMASDIENLDMEDPRYMARTIRRMADEMGEDLDPQVTEALERLESGEDPEKIERELEEADFGPPGKDTSPSRDPGLYEA